MLRCVLKLRPKPQAILTGGTCSFSRRFVFSSAGPDLGDSADPSATAVSAGPYMPAYSEQRGDGSGIPVLDQLIGYYVNIQSRKMYYKDFLRMEHQAVRWAFADIRKNSEALAHGLLQTGVRPGDRVLSIQPSNCESLVLQLACAKIGALLCVVPHHDISADKLRLYLNEFQPIHLVAREWINVKEVRKGGGGEEVVERNMHFWDTIYNVIPELGLSYPGQKFQWVHSSEFFFLKKAIITDHNTNLLGTTPLRKLLVWGPFSYYEQRLRRLSALLHPDDPVLTLQDPHPAMEDKRHIAYTHRHCTNAGFLLAQLLELKAETRFGVMPNHHIDPIGSILAPFAALTSGAVLVHLHHDLFTDEHAINAIEKLCVEEVSTILGTKEDFDMLLKHVDNFDTDQYEHLKTVVLFENAAAGDGKAEGEASTISHAYLEKLCAALQLDDVLVFRGPIEASYLVSWGSLKKGPLGLVPHTEVKIVGDRGAGEAKTLAEGQRGELRLKGPHVSAGYYNHAGLLTELVDENGFVRTSRDAIMKSSGELQILPPQLY